MTATALDIVILLPALNDGGAERSLVNLANELNRRGRHKVRFVLLRREGPYLDLIDPSIPVEGLTDRGDVLLSLPALVKKLKTLKPDILITALPVADLLAIWACSWLGKSAPVHICAIQNMRAGQFETFTRLRSKIKAKAMLFFYRKAQHFTAVSKAIAEELETLFKVAPKKITVIPNSLDLAQVQTQKNEPPDHPWLKPGRPYKTLIAAGRLVVQKDYPTLLKAMKEANDVRLIILGEGPERENIQKQISELGLQDYVDLAGFRKNHFALMAAADAFVLSSAWEGFGNVIIEALSVGTPVVATNCPGGPAEILEGGKYGALVCVNDPEALAAAIGKTLSGEHPAKDILIKRASEYSVQTIAGMYEAYFETLFSSSATMRRPSLFKCA